MINRIRRRMPAETDGYDPSSARLRSPSIELFMLGVEHWDGYQREVHASHHAVAATRLDEQGRSSMHGPEAIAPVPVRRAANHMARGTVHSVQIFSSGTSSHLRSAQLLRPSSAS